MIDMRAASPTLGFNDANGSRIAEKVEDDGAASYNHLDGVAAPNGMPTHESNRFLLKITYHPDVSKRHLSHEIGIEETAKVPTVFCRVHEAL